MIEVTKKIRKYKFQSPILPVNSPLNPNDYTASIYYYYYYYYCKRKWKFNTS